MGLNESTIKKYIQDQEKANIALDKLSVKEYADPFSQIPFRGSQSGEDSKAWTKRKPAPWDAGQYHGLLALVQTTRLKGGCDFKAYFSYR